MASVDFAEVTRAVRAATEDAVAAIGDDIADLYQQVAPRDSGTLARAFRHTVTSTGGGVIRLHGEVDDQLAPHGKWIDDPPDEIVPVRARALRWFASSGEAVFARRVVPSRVHEGWWRAFIDQFVDEILGR